MIVVGTYDAGRRPAIGRGIGTVVAAEGSHLDLFISRWQWPETIDNIEQTGQVAVTFSRPSDYMTYQVKGSVEAVEAANEGDQATIDRYLTEIDQALAGVGLASAVAERLLTCSDPVRVRFQPKEIYTQTPGPTAGTRIDGLNT
jgi:hypothetical protein